MVSLCEVALRLQCLGARGLLSRRRAKAWRWKETCTVSRDSTHPLLPPPGFGDAGIRTRGPCQNDLSQRLSVWATIRYSTRNFSCTSASTYRPAAASTSRKTYVPKENESIVAFVTVKSGEESLALAGKKLWKRPRPLRCVRAGRESQWKSASKCLMNSQWKSALKCLLKSSTTTKSTKAAGGSPFPTCAQ